MIDTEKMPKLGFRLMRLPEENGTIDMKQVYHMVDTYMQAGFDYFDTYVKYDCFTWAMQKKAEGKIKHFGFSFHGTPELLEQVLNNHPEVEFVQIQLNYADWNNQVVHSGKLYEILHKRELPIIVMEPVKGGTLANMAPELESLMKAEHSIRRACTLVILGQRCFIMGFLTAPGKRKIVSLVGNAKVSAHSICPLSNS